MKKNKVVAAAGAVALALGGLAVTATPASATSRGTISTKENKRLIREMNHQKCLTKTEARRIVHGQGHTFKDSIYLWGKNRKFTAIAWDGSNSSSLDGAIMFWFKGLHGCGTVVLDVYPHDKTKMWIKGQKRAF